MLYEAYISEAAFAYEDCEYIGSTRYTGWINHILGTSFSMKNRFELWNNVETILILENIEKYSKENANDKVLQAINEIIPRGREFEAIGLEYTDILYICNGTECMDEDKALFESGSYQADIYKCKCLIREYLKDTPTERLNQLILLLKKNYCDRKSDGIETWRRALHEEPIAPVRTSVFLRQNKSYAFRHTPDEIKAFRTMFYEFMKNGQNKEYVAAIVLFRRLIDSETYRKVGTLIGYVKSSWTDSSRNVTHNPARIKLKRYLSVMANTKLREKIFGF